MKKKIQIMVGILISAVLIWFLFHDTDWVDVWATIKNIHLGWLVAAHVPLLLGFVFRIIRWKYIVNSQHSVSMYNLASATQIGFLANFTLPLRAGEAVRAQVLTRLTRIPFSKSFAYVALDRVTDLLALIVVMLIALFAFQPESIITIPAATFDMAEDITFSPEMYNAGAIGIGLFLIAVLGAFALLYLRKAFCLKLVEVVVGFVSQPLADFGVRFLTQFTEGFEVFKSRRDMCLAVFFSMLTWLMTILFFFYMLKAFHIDAPWYTAFVMEALLAVAISVPGAPGFVGQFHVPIVVTLVMITPSIDIDEAKAFAIISHLAQLPPLIISAGYFMLKDGFKLMSLAHEGEESAHEEALHEIEEAEEASE